MSFISRNFSFCLANPLRTIAIVKAMDAYRKLHPECALSGCIRDPVTGKANDVHHIVPIHADPSRACDPSNFMTLCRFVHYWVGHCRNWKNWNSNPNLTVYDLRQAYTKSVTVCRQEGDTTEVTLKGGF